MKIFLIGFMGCGKSTKAKQLAQHLACPVIDLDAVIETLTGQTIANYFAQNGETAFRQLESETLKNYPYPTNCVVATGGGLPCFLNNINWMNTNGTTIYLQMEPAQLVARLHNREKRPLIAGLNDAQLLTFIATKLAERNPFYSQAHLTANAFNLTAENLVKMLKLV